MRFPDSFIFDDLLSSAIENGGTSLCRTQAIEKLLFSTAC